MRAASHQSRRLKGKRSREKERRGRVGDLQDQMLPPSPGECADWQKATAEGGKRGRKEGRKRRREGQKQTGRSEGGGGRVSQPMWQKVWLVPATGSSS